MLIEKYNPNKTLSAVYFDAEQGYYYVKRFQIDDSVKEAGFIGDYPGNKLISFTWVEHPRLELKFGGKNESREPEIVDVAEYIGVKSFKAKGKRLSVYEISTITELEPVISEEEMQEVVQEEETKTDIVIPDLEDLLFGIEKPTNGDEPPNQMEIEF
jgi:topoisomerase-4 subunit A